MDSLKPLWLGHTGVGNVLLRHRAKVRERVSAHLLFKLCGRLECQVENIEMGACSVIMTLLTVVIEIVEGRNALVGSFLDAGSAVTSGLWRYEVYKTGQD